MTATGSPLPPAYVIGSGPNGLTAAILLARAGLRTTLFEAQSTVGGGTRSAALTLPGFVHDVCSAVHPLAASSPVFATFPLAEHGLEWIHSPIPLAHPLDGGRAVLLHRSVEATAEGLGADAARYRQAFGSLASKWKGLAEDLLGPPRFPHRPLTAARFALLAPWPASWLVKTLFRGEEARALFAGMAAHSFLRMEDPISSAFGCVLGLAGHGVGWPVPRGGSQSIANALLSYFQALGGQVNVNTPIASLADFEPNALVLCDVTPRQLLRIAGDQLPASFRRKLQDYRYGPAVFKMDWALDGPVPWLAPECTRAATVHLGGTFEEIAASERSMRDGKEPERPFVLVAQPSLFDRSRAPEGKHTLWAYCHVPNGSTKDMTNPIESQIERFAPGFRKRILATSKLDSRDLEARNSNLVGGDINGGSMDLFQFFTRPTTRLYRTPRKGLYLCSSSTPPGGAVHGGCGWGAAMAALHDFHL